MKRDKILYAILKEIDNGNRSFDHNDFGISQDEFMDILRYAHREKYIDDVFYADNIVYFYGNATITSLGKKYLTSNSKWAKSCKILKEVRDLLKI